MKFSKFSFVVFFALLFCDVMFAQSSVLANSYFCNFEDSAENNKWELKVGAFAERCANKWYIGKPGSANNGEAGLFISCDNGVTSNYTNKAVTVMAYRELTLEAGDYELSFDWKAGGTEFNDGLYVCLVPTSDRDARLASTTSSILDNWVKRRPEGYALDFGRDAICLNQRYWNTVVDSIHITPNETYNLVFIWCNDLSIPYSSGACIDNIMIRPKGVCNRPSDFRINPKGSDLLLSWMGDAEAYDVQIYDYTTETWSEYKNIEEKYLELKGLDEGMKSFFVRSVCDTLFSAWTSRDRFVYHSSLSCIDFLNLTSLNCFTNTFDNQDKGRKPEVVDNGSLSVYSRHTIHWDKNETDPRTGNGLKTVPDGELASVRIGGAKAGEEIEEIEYNLYVDESSAVLMLNYAVVLEYHASVTQVHTNASFTLEIREGSKPLGVHGCGEANFTAGKITSGEDGWNIFAPGEIIPVQWKDWTMVAIDLRQYIGKSLTIKISTKDCSLGGHWGYAYFTLRCTDGKIQGLTCGGSGEKTEFLAPDGFKYRWYDPKKPNVTLGTEQKFSIEANDTATYYVDVIQPTNSNCFYTEHVSGVGRWPRAKADYKLDIKNCENNVIFENQSFIQLVNQVNNDSSATTNKCDEFFWDFGDGDTSIVENPVHRYPDEGGTYTVRLQATIAGGCDGNWTSFDITLPKIGTTYDTTRAAICRNEYYIFEGDTIYENGIYVDTLQSIYGCDSIVVLDLFVAEKFDTMMYDTICIGEEYYFRGQLLSESGVYSDTTQSPYGCDSIFTIHFEVIEPLNISLAKEDISGCEDDDHIDVNFEFAGGARKPVEYSIYFDNNALSQGFVNQERLSLDETSNEFVILLPDSCTPDTYTATFLFYDTTFICSDVSIPVSFDIYYSASMLQPKFDNLITILDRGYDFVDDAYEWYVNGVRDSSAVGAFYYLPNGQTFGEDDCYYMVATRRGDGKKIRTCEICPGIYTSVDDTYDSNGMLQITIFNKEQTIETDIEKGLVNIYSLAGELLCSYQCGVDRIKVPAKSGLYILQIVLEDRNYTHKILVK